MVKLSHRLNDGRFLLRFKWRNWTRRIKIGCNFDMRISGISDDCLEDMDLPEEGGTYNTEDDNDNSKRDDNDNLKPMTVDVGVEETFFAVSVISDHSTGLQLVSDSSSRFTRTRVFIISETSVTRVMTLTNTRAARTVPHFTRCL